MLQPSRVKYRNKHRGRRKGKASLGSVMNFGDVGLKAIEQGVARVTRTEAELREQAIRIIGEARRALREQVTGPG